MELSHREHYGLLDARPVLCKGPWRIVKLIGEIILLWQCKRCDYEVMAPAKPGSEGEVPEQPPA